MFHTTRKNTFIETQKKKKKKKKILGLEGKQERKSREKDHSWDSPDLGSDSNVSNTTVYIINATMLTLF